MCYSHSYEEFMPEKDISNSFDGLEQSRIEWEKKIKFLLLLDNFGSFGLFGSAKHKDFNNIKITRTYIKNYLETFNISEHIDWIEQTMPNKIIKIVSKDITFLDFEVQDQIESEPEYISCVNPLKYKLIIENYNTLTPDDKIKIYSKIINKYEKFHCGNLLILKAYLKTFFSNSSETKEQIIKFFDSLRVFNMNKLLTYVDELYNKNRNDVKKSSSIFNSYSFYTKTDNFDIWKEKLEIFKNINDDEFVNTLNLHKIAEEMNKNVSVDDKIKFVDEYFLNAERDTICEMGNYYDFKDIFKNIGENKELKTLIKNTKYEIFKTKYYDKLDKETKTKYTIYSLDYNSHWELCKLDEEKYMKIITYNVLINDYTFCSYNFDNFSFLNGYNDEVQTYLKNKIHADLNHIINNKSKHTKICKLDNLIDIMYFIHNPPVFLRPVDRKFYPDYIELMNEYLNELNYDFSKINYLNMKPRIVYEVY